MKRIMLLALALCMVMCLYTSQALATYPAESYAWYDATKTNLEISSAADLLGLAAIANGEAPGITKDNFEGKVVKLTADIDLGGIPWTPISSWKGELDGNGKTISHFTINIADGKRGGFFHTIEGGDGKRVHDLTVQNVNATVGNGWFGTLAYSVKGKIQNVSVREVTVTTTHVEALVGGLCGGLGYAISDCTVSNLEVNAQKGAIIVGGLVAVSDTVPTISNCNVNGFKATVVYTTDEYGVGGLIGQTQIASAQTKITNCHVSGMDITASGAIAVGGFMTHPGAHTTVIGCTVQGKIDATGITDGCAGGFFGDVGWNNDHGYMGHKISNCTANVDIVTKTASAGGFVGSATNFNNRSMYAEFENCTASGNITSVQGGSAPVGGFAGKADRGHYTNCKATGNVSGSVAGGFIGLVKDVTPSYATNYPAGTRSYDANEILLDGVSASGTVLGTDKTGGLIGHVGEGTASGKGAEGKLIIRNSSATDTVVGSSQDTDVEAILNRNEDNHKKMEGPDDKTTGASSIIVPVDADSRLTMDANGDIIIPEEGATLIKNGESTLLPGGTIVRDGKIILPEPDPTPTPVPTATPVPTTTPEPASVPRTGVPGVEGYAVLALLSAACAALLLNLRRKASRG